MLKFYLPTHPRCHDLNKFESIHPQDAIIQVLDFLIKCFVRRFLSNHSDHYSLKRGRGTLFEKTLIRSTKNALCHVWFN